eukprot:6204201-Pleurochrysis_carterae.AAC.7
MAKPSSVLPCFCYQNSGPGYALAAPTLRATYRLRYFLVPHCFTTRIPNRRRTKRLKISLRC